MSTVLNKQNIISYFYQAITIIENQIICCDNKITEQDQILSRLEIDIKETNNQKNGASINVNRANEMKLNKEFEVQQLINQKDICTTEITQTSYLYEQIKKKINNRRVKTGVKTVAAGVAFGFIGVAVYGAIRASSNEMNDLKREKKQLSNQLVEKRNYLNHINSLITSNEHEITSLCIQCKNIENDEQRHTNEFNRMCNEKTYSWNLKLELQKELTSFRSLLEKVNINITLIERNIIDSSFRRLTILFKENNLYLPLTETQIYY